MEESSSLTKYVLPYIEKYNQIHSLSDKLKKIKLNSIYEKPKKTIIPIRKINFKKNNSQNFLPHMSLQVNNSRNENMFITSINAKNETKKKISIKSFSSHLTKNSSIINDNNNTYNYYVIKNRFCLKDNKDKNNFKNENKNIFKMIIKDLSTIKILREIDPKKMENILKNKNEVHEEKKLNNFKSFSAKDIFSIGKDFNFNYMIKKNKFPFPED